MYITNMLLHNKKAQYEKLIDTVGLTLKAQALKRDIVRLEKKVAIKQKK